MSFCHGLSPSHVEARLSKDRLSTYSALVSASSIDQKLGAYIWSLELNSALAPLLSMVEVLIRNSLHDAATHAFGKANWLDGLLKWNGDIRFQAGIAALPNLAGTHYRKGCPPHDKKTIWVNNTQKSLRPWKTNVEVKREDIIKRIQSAGKPITPNQQVASAMFGFWIDLFGPTFEDASDPHALWPRLQTAVFPADPTMSRAKALQFLSDIKHLRNRISHHEPAFSLAKPKTPAGVHAYMTHHISEMCELVNAISSDALTYLRNCGVLARLDSLLSPQTISSYAGQQGNPVIDSRGVTKMIRKMAKNASRRKGGGSATPAASTDIKVAGITVVTVMPYA